MKECLELEGVEFVDKVLSGDDRWGKMMKELVRVADYSSHVMRRRPWLQEWKRMLGGIDYGMSSRL